MTPACPEPFPAEGGTSRLQLPRVIPRLPGIIPVAPPKVLFRPSCSRPFCQRTRTNMRACTVIGRLCYSQILHGKSCEQLVGNVVHSLFTAKTRLLRAALPPSIRTSITCSVCRPVERVLPCGGGDLKTLREYPTKGDLALAKGIAKPVPQGRGGTRGTLSRLTFVGKPMAVPFNALAWLALAWLS